MFFSLGSIQHCFTYVCTALARTRFCAVTYILIALTTEQRGVSVGPGRDFGPGLSV